MKSLVSLSVGMAAVVMVGGAQAAPAHCLDVRLSSASPIVRGDVDVEVQVAVTNTCRHPVQVLGWQLPSDDVEGALFSIARDGQRVAYQGPVYKRTKPEAGDHVKLEAGATLSYTVELTGSYDLSQNGHYTVSYAAKGGSSSRDLASGPMHLWLEGRSGKVSSSAPLPSLIQPAAASLSYTGRCSSSQISTLKSAVTAATNYSVQSASYLSNSPAATPRYTTWFGAFSTTGWNTAKDHFVKARDAFQTQALTLDCSCKKKGTYAYVYPNQPYKIYVCGAFWSAPMTGADSKGGTLVHEMMHFSVIAGTDDWAYGQAAAKQLAIDNPTKAQNNSDNHEYFAENTPALP